jgi:hypothetical protein
MEGKNLQFVCPSFSCLPKVLPHMETLCIENAILEMRESKEKARFCVSPGKKVYNTSDIVFARLKGESCANNLTASVIEKWIKLNWV